MNSGKTLCIILHYGPEDDTWACVDSLLCQADLDIVVADNDPRQRLTPSKELPENVRILKTGGKSGFAEGNNIAVKEYLGPGHDSVLILNNDTFVDESALVAMRNALRLDRVGAVGPCIFYTNTEDIWACGGWINKRKLLIGGHSACRNAETYDVDYLPGAAILCNARIWRELRGLPERYFLAYEEAEFALEIKRLGYRVVVNPKARISHRVGISSRRDTEYYYNNLRNRVIFSKYLYGARFGLFFGVIITSLSIWTKSLNTARSRLILWWWAVADEISGKKLDRERLVDIAQASVRYRVNLP